MASSSSSWATKFEKKLKALTEGGASKESIQTLVTWMVFNRKHVLAFSQILLSLPDLTSAATTVGVPTTSISKQTLYWQLIHQVLLSNKEDHDKWERALEMRIILGESVLLVALPSLCSNNNNDDDETSTTATIMDLIEGMIKEWDQHNVFGGPTLTGQIKRILLTAKSTKSTPALTTITTTAAAAEVSPTDANVVVATDAPPAVASSIVDPQQAEAVVPPKEESSPLGNMSPLQSSSSPQPTPSPGGKQPPQQPQNYQRRESISSVHSEQQPVPVEYNFDNSVRGEPCLWLLICCFVFYVCWCIHSLAH